MDKETLKLNIGLAIITSALSAIFAVRLEANRVHQQVIENLRVLNCTNLVGIGKPLHLVQEQFQADWNLRYLTDFYDSVWSDILQQYGTHTPNFVVAVYTMKNVNAILERIDRFKPQGDDRITAFRDVLAGVNKVTTQMNLLGITDDSCKDIIGVYP